MPLPPDEQTKNAKTTPTSSTHLPTTTTTNNSTLDDSEYDDKYNGEGQSLPLTLALWLLCPPSDPSLSALSNTTTASAVNIAEKFGTFLLSIMHHCRDDDNAGFFSRQKIVQVSEMLHLKAKSIPNSGLDSSAGQGSDELLYFQSDLIRAFYTHLDEGGGSIESITNWFIEIIKTDEHWKIWKYQSSLRSSTFPLSPSSKPTTPPTSPPHESSHIQPNLLLSPGFNSRICSASQTLVDENPNHYLSIHCLPLIHTLFQVRSMDLPLQSFIDMCHQCGEESGTMSLNDDSFDDLVALSVLKLFVTNFFVGVQQQSGGGGGGKRIGGSSEWERDK